MRATTMQLEREMPGEGPTTTLGGERAKARLCLRLIGLYLCTSYLGVALHAVLIVIGELDWTQLARARFPAYLAAGWRMLREFARSQDGPGWLTDSAPHVAIWLLGVYFAAGKSWPLLPWLTKEVQRGRLHVVPPADQGDGHHLAGVRGP